MTIATLDPAAIAGQVEPEELARLLGLPRHRSLDEQAAELAEGARAWYAEQGRPYRVTRYHRIEAWESDGVRLEAGVRLGGRAFLDQLRRDEAHAVVGIAASAGVEVDRAAKAMWLEGRPDQGYVLERFAIAVVERLLAGATLDLCQHAEQDGATLTPHLSPGCGEWELEHQHSLWEAIFPNGGLGPIELLPSGGLSPKYSILGAAGVTRRAVTSSPLDPCRSCSLARCRFRRVPFRGPR